MIAQSAIDTLLKKTAAEYGVPQGICIAGTAHRRLFRITTGNGPAADDDSVFWIYSATKTVTAAAAMQMLERGLFSLDDRVDKYLPEYSQLFISEGNTARPASKPLRVRDLLSMQGGFDYRLKTPAVRAVIRETEGKATTRQIVRAFAKSRLQFEPGTHFFYSICLDILGGLMEAASGMTLGEWMRDNIFQPLGMNSTGFAPDAGIKARMLPQYRREEDGTIDPIDDNCFCRLTDAYESAGGGLYSTCADIAVFADALACGGTGKSGARILTEDSVKRMGLNLLTPRGLRDYRTYYTRPGYGYGHGVRVSTGEGPEPAGAFGWDGAAGAHIFIDPSSKLSLVYLQHVHGMDFLYDNEFAQLDALLYTDRI